MKKKRNTKLFDWQEKCKDNKNSCADCGDNRTLSVDHIIPVDLLLQFCIDKNYGLYEMEENFQILCRYCNSKKSNRIDVKNKKTYLILEKIINQAKEFYIK